MSMPAGSGHSRESLGNYSALDTPTPPRVVDSRRSIRVTVDLDCADVDWNRIVIPGQACGEDVDPPVSAIEMLEQAVQNLLYQLSEDRNMDAEVMDVRARLGQVTKYTTLDKTIS